MPDPAQTQGVFAWLVVLQDNPVVSTGDKCFRPEETFQLPVSSTHHLVYPPHSPNLIGAWIQVTHALDRHIFYQETLFHTQTGSSRDESPGSVRPLPLTFTGNAFPSEEEFKNY